MIMILILLTTLPDVSNWIRLAVLIKLVTATRTDCRNIPQILRAMCRGLKICERRHEFTRFTTLYRS